MSLGFLPEGPIELDSGSFSWVGIQHGADATSGSLNRFSIEDGENQSTSLNGRPGFAFPLDGQGGFVVGLERQIVRLQLGSTGELLEESVLFDGVDAEVSGTIINDGAMTNHGILFGCKDLKFAEKKAGLYFWDNASQTLHQLRADQTCSNGKVIVEDDGSRVAFLDIDTPTQKVMRYVFDLHEKRLVEESVALDVANQTGFPDGMVGTPDGKGVVIAFFNPEVAPYGRALWIDLATGEVQQEWRTEGSPQVTCPMLLRRDDATQLVLTTAAENMTDEQRTACPNAGCLFIAETDF